MAVELKKSIEAIKSAPGGMAQALVLGSLLRRIDPGGYDREAGRRVVEAMVDYNPDGMSCTESLAEAVSGSIDSLKDIVFADEQVMRAVILDCIGRLDNARVREAERREACTTTPT